MNIKTKGLFKVLVIALSMLFAVALAFGISGAWYNTTREAKGTLSMAKGIVIDYSGFNQGADVWEDNASFNLFASQNGMLPGQSVELYNTKIKANASSIDFYARAKLEYKFFTDVEGLTEVTSQIADYSAFINTPTFAQGWVDSGFGDGWFYYATGATFNTVPSADYVDIFAPGQSLTLNIDAPGFNHQGGGYQYSNEILIKRITVTLTLNALQANTAAAEFNGWEIYVPQVVENSSSQVVEILQNQITLGDVGGAYKLGTGEADSLAYDTTTLGTTLKIVVAGDSQINANAFNGSDLTEVYIGDQEYINGVSSYAARIYDTDKPTFTIGSNVFKGDSNIAINLSSSINYNIYTNAISSDVEVYYDGNSISLPTTAGAVEGTNITMIKPTIATGGVGAGTVNLNVSENFYYGEYTYEDEFGNIWYFDIDASKTGADIKFCTKNIAGNQTLIFPEIIVNNELSGIYRVFSLDGYESWSFDDDFGWISDGVYYSGIPANNIILPETLEYIGDGAFSYTNLTSITIPNSVRVIGYQTFYECNELNSIVMPSSLAHIGESAFAYTGISSIIIPNLVEDISCDAFSSCSNLATITIDSSTIAALDSSDSCLLDNATTVYVLEGLTVGTYITDGFSTTTSDKAGYVKYVKNS